MNYKSKPTWVFCQVIENLAQEDKQGRHADGTGKKRMGYVGKCSMEDGGTSVHDVRNLERSPQKKVGGDVTLLHVKKYGT